MNEKKKVPKLSDDYQAGLTQGRFEMLAKINASMPEAMVAREVNNILDMPLNKALDEVAMMMKKKNPTLKDALVIAKVNEMLKSLESEETK